MTDARPFAWRIAGALALVAMTTACNALLGNDDKVLESDNTGLDATANVPADATAEGSGGDGSKDSNLGDASPDQSRSDDGNTRNDIGDDVTRKEAGDDADSGFSEGGFPVDADAGPEVDADEGSAGAEAGDVDVSADAGFAGGEAGDVDVSSGCGPTNTVQNCTTCGTPCDIAHSVGASCNGATCSYSGCASGWLDCDRTPPNANGCETASSASNCAACGQACDTSTGTPSCLGSTCSYACNPGHSDCNVLTAPDTDGCECATPNCCGSSCQIVHSNGVGQPFYDCAPRGTYNATEQLAACAAFTGDATQCTSVSTLCFYVQASVVCSTGASQCYCWYLPASAAPDASASSLGLVQPSTTSTCMCPALTSSTSPCTSPGCTTWN